MTICLTVNLQKVKLTHTYIRLMKKEYMGTIKGSAQATQAALSHTRAQSNPTVKRGPPKRTKRRKPSKEQPAGKNTQTKDKEKPL